MLVLSNTTLDSHHGNVLPYERHKSQWTLQEQQKWASHWLSAHDKSPKTVSTKRNNNYTRSRKKNLRKKARYSLRNFIHEYYAWNHVDDFMSDLYYNPKHDNIPEPRFWDIHCNRDYQFTHSLSTLEECAPDIFLNRTVHITFTNHDIPIRGELTCISSVGFIRLQNVKLRSVTATHKTYRFDGSHLVAVGGMQNAYWFHLKCIGRVLVYEERERRYVDVTSMMMDLMKLKIIRYIEYEKFSVEQDTVKCHTLLLKKHHQKQLEQMRFGMEEFSTMIRDYVRIGGDFGESDGADERKRKVKGYMCWDGEHIEKMSRKMCRRTC